MLRILQLVCSLGLLGVGLTPIPAEAWQEKSGSSDASARQVAVEEWNQWRGPNRDGVLKRATFPAKLDEGYLKKQWSVELGPSYSGPIVVGNRVFTTETRDKKYEVVTAFDRKSGDKIWSTQWQGAMSVPFFARANGSWIRSTPVYSDGRLYVAGIRDVLVCLDAETGTEIWKVDFPASLGTSVPSFGFVCSPLIDGNDLYVQAGGAFCKLNKVNGEIIWKGLQDGGGMNGSAFSSPIITTIAGKRQAVVQTRPRLCGVDLETGETLWSQDIPTFRGMNIITPTVFEGNLFNTSYGGATQLISLRSDGENSRRRRSGNCQYKATCLPP
jgi:outer membrane protein assembly factor BamB